MHAAAAPKSNVTLHAASCCAPPCNRWLCHKDRGEGKLVRHPTVCGWVLLPRRAEVAQITKREMAAVGIQKKETSERRAIPGVDTLEGMRAQHHVGGAAPIVAPLCASNGHFRWHPCITRPTAGSRLPKWPCSGKPLCSYRKP